MIIVTEAPLFEIEPTEDWELDATTCDLCPGLIGPITIDDFPRSWIAWETCWAVSPATDAATVCGDCLAAIDAGERNLYRIVRRHGNTTHTANVNTAHEAMKTPGVTVLVLVPVEPRPVATRPLELVR